jgi:hypothetical protein
VARSTTTTFAKEKDKRFGIAEHISVGKWNVRGLTHKLGELQEELESKQIGIAIITETKKEITRNM